jgi:hypothetical protein
VTTEIGGITITDELKDSLVVERWEDGRISVWVSDPDGVESRSVWLDESARRKVAAYLLAGLA